MTARAEAARLYARIALADVVPRADLRSRRLQYGPGVRQHVVVVCSRTVRPVSAPVLFFHGGSWNSGAAYQYLFVARFLAARGIPAAIAGYRLVPDAVFPAQRDDALSAARVVAEWLGRDDLIAAGFSAGGHLAGLLAYDEESRRAAGLGVIRPLGMLSLAGVLDLRVTTGPLVRAYVGEPPYDAANPAALAARSPEVPALLIHGSSDHQVSVQGSRSFARELQSAGGAVELLEIGGAGHLDMLRLFVGNGTKHTQNVLKWITDVSAVADGRGGR